MERDAENRDVAKLFFDSFSRRVGSVEDAIHTISSELEKLRTSTERSQISDLVLLERIQKAEALMRESFGSIKAVLEGTYRREEKTIVASSSASGPAQKPSWVQLPGQEEVPIASRVLSPTGEVGSLPSITTPTELQVLTMLASEGPKSAPEIGRLIGRSREHTARLMKKLYEEGYIRRDQTRIPFRYSVVDRLRQSVKKQEPKDAAREQISVPQT